MKFETSSQPKRLTTSQLNIVRDASELLFNLLLDEVDIAVENAIAGRDKDYTKDELEQKLADNISDPFLQKIYTMFSLITWASLGRYAVDDVEGLRKRMFYIFHILNSNIEIKIFKDGKELVPRK